MQKSLACHRFRSLPVAGIVSWSRGNRFPDRDEASTPFSCPDLRPLTGNSEPLHAADQSCSRKSEVGGGAMRPADYPFGSAKGLDDVGTLGVSDRHGIGLADPPTSTARLAQGKG